MRELTWIVVALTGLALPSLALQQTTTPAVAQPSVHLDVDAIAAGNTANAVGPINKTVQRRVGESFEVDVVVQNAHDLLGFGFDFTFDPSVVHVTRVNVNMLLAIEPESSVADFTKNFAAPEDVDGLITPAAADFAQGAAASSRGSGVLVRVTFVAASCGVSALTVRPNSILGPMLQDSTGALFNPPAVGNGEVLVAPAEGADCPVEGEASQPVGAEGPSQNSVEGRESDAATDELGHSPSEAANELALPGQSRPPNPGAGDSAKSGDEAGVADSETSGAQEKQSQTESDGWFAWVLLIGMPTAAAVAILAVAGRILWRRSR